MPHARSTLAVPPPVGVAPAHDARATADSARSGSTFTLPFWLRFDSWQGRLLWILVLIGPVWLLDKPLFDLGIPDRKILLLGDIRDVTRQFGEPVGIAWIGAVLWFLDRSRRRPLVIALVATLIASGLGSGAKLLIGRERPKVSQGHTVLRGAHWPGTMEPDPSFPSGHTTVAFAFAFGLSRLYPVHRKLWLVLATGCGLSRALGEAHFLTDVLVGAWLGWEIARLAWDWTIGPLLIWRMNRRIPDCSWFPRWDATIAG
jgi:membrane-associated phospholipid phosphatase